jgi:hypothetical protein
MDFISSLFSALSADAALTGLLAVDENDDPAIFSGDVAPDGFPKEKPHIWIRPPHGGKNFDTMPAGGAAGANFGRALDLDLSFYAMASESSEGIDAAAERARIVLHRATLDNGETCTVSGPFNAPTSGPEIAGRRLAVRLNVKG